MFSCSPCTSFRAALLCVLQGAPSKIASINEGCQPTVCESRRGPTVQLLARQAEAALGRSETKKPRTCSDPLQAAAAGTTDAPGAQLLSDALQAKITLSGTPRSCTQIVAAALTSDAQRKAFVEAARIQAVLDSAPRSHPRLASGLRAWGLFADSVLGLRGNHIPPTVEGLVAWSTVFSNVGTYRNYLGAVSFACAVAGVAPVPADHPLLVRAKAAVKNRQGAPRTNRFIRMPLLRRLMSLAAQEGDHSE